MALCAGRSRQDGRGVHLRVDLRGANDSGMLRRMSHLDASDTGSSAGPWHVHASALPVGGDPRDWWIRDGCLTDVPVPDAAPLPGAWLLPGGLVDAHAHLTMNFGRRMPHADGSDTLVEANLLAHLQTGVLACPRCSERAIFSRRKNAAIPTSAAPSPPTNWSARLYRTLTLAPSG